MSKILEKYVGKYCVFRTYTAGVHLGILEEIEEGDSGINANISEGRRLHFWEGAFTLHAVADKGIDFKKSRLSETKKGIYSISQIIEILPIAEELIDKYKTTHAHQS